MPAETFAGFTADQISNLSPTHFREHWGGPDININPEQISHITLDAMSGITSAHLSAAGVSSGTLIGAFSPEQISHLNAPVNGPTTDYSLMQQAMEYLSQYPETVEDFTDADMSFFTPEAVSWFPAGFVAELPAETFAGFTADQISNLSPLYFVEGHFGPDININPEQISHITLDAIAGLNLAQATALSQSGELLTALSEEQIFNLQPDCQILIETALENYLAAQEATQAATEDAVEENLSEPASEEEPASEQSAAEEVVDESSSEPASEEGTNDTATPDNPFSRVIRGREREDQDDGRETTREARETDKEEQSQWGEKGDALKGVKLKPLDEKEGSAEKYNDPISQAKEKFIDKNEAEHASSSPVNQMETSILAAIDQQMAANMAKDSKQSSKQSDDENSTHDSENQQNENTEI